MSEALCSAVQVLKDVSNITGNTRDGIDVRYGIRSSIILDHMPRKPHSSASCEACARVAPGPFVRDFPAKRRRQVACPASYILGDGTWHGTLALTAPTICMKLHSHVKYYQHDSLYRSQAYTCTRSCSAWHAAPAPRHGYSAYSAVRHSQPQTCFHARIYLFQT